VNPISIGKYWGLQRCAAAHGALSVLALDHRRSLRKALGTSGTKRASDIEMSVFKQQVASTLAPAASAILLDPEVGALQCIASGALPGAVGLVVALEASGYAGEATARESGLLPGWSVAKAKRMGASAIKLLVYYHPDSSNAHDVEELVRQVDEDCAEQDMTYFLEPLTYSLRPDVPLRADERRRVIIETARRLTSIGGDVLKAEFPLDITTHPDERDWAAACATLSEVSRVPWVLLSASVDFDTYLRQVTVACREGASGVMVGRAVWKEAAALTGDARERFLNGTAFARMQRITALCNALARPWTALFRPVEITSKSYQTY
jgi:tagatose 1,6-diphosphate aldolase